MSTKNLTTICKNLIKTCDIARILKGFFIKTLKILIKILGENFVNILNVISTGLCTSRNLLLDVWEEEQENEEEA